MRILITDDDFVSRTKLHALLAPYGVCELAEDGDQAWQMFQAACQESKPYRLVCMDIDMPGMNGHEVVTRIRKWEADNQVHKSGQEARILMISSMKSRSDIISSFNEGCESFIKKPITPDNLAKSLALLGFPRLTPVGK